MPRRLSKKTRHVRPRHFKKREKKYNALGFQKAPVKEGQEINVVIDDIGSRGDGITRIQDFLIFVPQAKVRERLKVKILKVGRKFAIAEKIKQEREEEIED
ncbi:TRAM domain-containing protein [Candidatus Bathyarchaeota archaeon]|nr:TRAM domain-containing protein [Candidatus Bathyarchaeota archaeon]